MRTFNKQILKFWHSPKQYDHIKSKWLPLGYTSQTFPDELLFLTPILNQNDGSGRNDCTAFMSCAVRQSMKGKAYDTDGQWGLEMAFGGNLPAPDGFPLETPFAVGRKTGFIPSGQTSPTDNASAYFWIKSGGGLDLFDAIRLAIQQNHCPVGAGLLWYSDWDNAPQGIIPNFGNQPLGGHAIKIAGWKQINGQPYLVAQNSWGTSYGDNGLYYLSRTVANKVLNYGVAYWSDSPDQTIKTLGLIQALYANLILLLQKTLIYTGFHL